VKVNKGGAKGGRELVVVDAGEMHKQVQASQKLQARQAVLSKMTAGVTQMEEACGREAADARYCLSLMACPKPIPFNWPQRDLDRLYNNYRPAAAAFPNDNVLEDVDTLLDEMEEAGVQAPLQGQPGKFYLVKPSDKKKYWIGMAMAVDRCAQGHRGVRMQWYQYDRYPDGFHKPWKPPKSGLHILNMVYDEALQEEVQLVDGRFAKEDVELVKYWVERWANPVDVDEWDSDEEDRAGSPGDDAALKTLQQQQAQYATKAARLEAACKTLAARLAGKKRKRASKMTKQLAGPKASSSSKQ